MVWKGGNGVDCREWDWTEWRGTIHDWFRGPVLAQIYLQEDGWLMATRGWHGCIRNWWRKWEPTYKQQVGEKLPFTIIPKSHVCTMEDRIIHEQKSCRKARHYIPGSEWIVSVRAMVATNATAESLTMKNKPKACHGSTQRWLGAETEGLAWVPQNPGRQANEPFSEKKAYQRRRSVPGLPQIS